MLHVVREFLGNSAGPAFWIGRRCWPHIAVLEESLLRRCVFIDPPDDASRLWAIDLVARFPGAVVVADGSRLDMAASRRLQLACEAGESLVLCARPAAERALLSAASARWLVRSAPSGDGSPCWKVELLRFKGKEWTDAQRGVVVHAALVGGPGPALSAAGRCPA
jgi:protein ImuA